MVLQIQRRLNTSDLRKQLLAQEIGILAHFCPKTYNYSQMVLFIMNGFIWPFIWELDTLKINLSRRCPISNGHEKPFFA